MFLTIMVATAFAALPPGYDEEVYCPGGMCLRKRTTMKILKGFSGPRAMFLECFNPSTKEIRRPRVWGAKVEQSYKDSLLKENWHTGECDDDKVKKVGDDALLNDYLLLGSRMDKIIETLAILSFI